MFGWLKKKSESFLSPEFQQELAERETDFTPDRWKLEQKIFHNVLIYNELMKGCSKYSEIMDGHAVKTYTGFSEDAFVMMKMKAGTETFPFAMPVFEDQKFGRSTFLGTPAYVCGQLFTMRPQQVIKLDKYLLNTVQFNRVRLGIDIFYRERTSRTQHSPQQRFKMRAWMYVARPEFWTDMLNPSLFGTVKLHTANQGKENLERRYYFFNEDFESTQR